MIYTWEAPFVGRLGSSDRCRTSGKGRPTARARTVDPHHGCALAKPRGRGATAICQNHRPVSSYADLYDVADDIVTLRVHAQPGGGRSAVMGRQAGALKVKVAAPPIDDRANEAVAELLARTFGLKVAQVQLVSGASSRGGKSGLSPSGIRPGRRSAGAAGQRPGQ